MPNGGSKNLPLYRYDQSGNRIENITDWGLKQFTKHYKNEKITKEDIFHYTYGVLHNPVYREKYELNLKREFPRLPFYKDFYKWVNWGKELMDLHINYETVEPFGIKIQEEEKQKENPKAKLRRNKETNEIILDENTSITGIPEIAFDYKLGNRSAIDWILDQYKEKKPRDKTIAEKFNTYKFADYKDTVIDLIKRVTTVSVRTMKIVNQMEAEEPHTDKKGDRNV
jgi:predicted helicase